MFLINVEEPKYESIEIIVRSPENGTSWFDRIFVLITKDCNEEGDTCSCGLESMGGSTGTLDQCYDHMRLSSKWATVKTEDLKKILGLINPKELLFDHLKVSYENLRKEAYWHDEFDEWLTNGND